MDVILEYDLVDTVKPGDLVRCVGVFRALKFRNASSELWTAVVANSLAKQGQELCATQLSHDEDSILHEFVKTTGVLDQETFTGITTKSVIVGFELVGNSSRSCVEHDGCIICTIDLWSGSHEVSTCLTVGT